ncbi:MAG TPA: protein phosphatase 2C domain-containing protein [Candidatus Eisenbacteria bacterium]|nr:protein phosphatase 2C domain-containing protein [Candidatus Eisenbacteria bacterium]
MTPEATPISEPLRSPEVQKPSPALALRLHHGGEAFNADVPLSKDSENDSFKSAVTALDNHNRVARKADEAKFAQTFKGPKEEMRHNQMLKWSNQAFVDMSLDLNVRGEPIAKIFHDKLHFDFGDGVADDAAIRKQFYDADTQTEGSFYKEFCGTNMNEKLTTLSVDEMMLLKGFLTKWMLGSEDAFNALVTLKQSMDIVDNAVSTSVLDTLYDKALPEADKPMLDYFHKGLSLKDEDEEEKIEPTATEEVGTAQSEQNLEQLPLAITSTGEKTEVNPEHPERNDDTYFFDAENLRGGIFDGAGGHTGSDKASRAAQNAIREVMDRFPLKGNFPELPIKEQFLEAFNLASDRVRALGEGKTTASVFQVVRSAQDGSPKLLVGNIGDSRVWIRRKDGTITQVTQDGNAVRNWYRQALKNTDNNQQAVEHAYNDISRVLDTTQKREDIPSFASGYWDRRNEANLLGAEDFTERFEFFESPIEDGDTIFLTTDGVHDNLTLQEITAIAHEIADPQAFSEALVAKAKGVADLYDPTKPFNQQAVLRAKPDDITAFAAILGPRVAQQPLAQAA